MKNKIDKEIKEQLAKDRACYILITCDQPTQDGNMNVEMNYDGDPMLAGLLLQKAQEIIDIQQEREEEKISG